MTNLSSSNIRWKGCYNKLFVCVYIYILYSASNVTYYTPIFFSFSSHLSLCKLHENDLVFCSQRYFWWIINVFFLGSFLGVFSLTENKKKDFFLVPTENFAYNAVFLPCQSECKDKERGILILLLSICFTGRRRRCLLQDWTHRADLQNPTPVSISTDVSTA